MIRNSAIFYLLTVLAISTSASPYLPGRVIVQFQEGAALPQTGSLSTSHTWLDATLAQAGLYELKQLHTALQHADDSNARALGRTWECFLSPDADVITLSRTIMQQPGITWAEPRWGRQTFGLRTPDDPFLPQQWHLDMLECETAWWWTAAASPDAVIGILDSGVDYEHPDLAPNIWINPGEDLNHNGVIDPSDWDGVDNEGNGKIDDFWGWDFVNIGQAYVWPGEDGEGEDNDPSDFLGHGTSCAGDASEVSDNTTGGAGVGWQARLMAVRVGGMSSQGQGLIYYSSDGIVYAADAGADVISMSYGGGSSYWEQQAINYAFGLGVVCVAAAGNESTSQTSFPAGYEHVIAVGATNSQDHMAGFSNYGAWVDVYAPGEAIFATTMNGGYGNASGTSMACPVTAGTAALLKALYPNLSSDQVSERLVSTCDIIQTGNPLWPQGPRLNAGHAVDWVCGVADFQILSPDSTGRIYAGQSVDMVITLVNHTAANLTGISAQITSDDPELTIVNGTFTVSSLSVGQETTNASTPYVLTLSPSFQGFRSANLALHVTGSSSLDYTQTLEVLLGRAEVLIVNADQNQSQEAYYYYSVTLDNLEKSWEIWDVSRSGSPAVAFLSQYPTIIWYTGNAEQNVLPVDHTQALAQYLDGGGHLLLSGQNAARYLSQTQNPFLAEYLNCVYTADSSNNFVVTGNAGNPIVNGMQFVILGSGGAQNQTSPDVIQVQAPGEEMAKYGGTGTIRGAALHTTAHGKVVFLAFGFEAINDSVSSYYTTRTTLMASILNWFAGVGVLPGEGNHPLPNAFALRQNYPNPFNPTTVISFDLPVSSYVTLDIFDIQGRSVGAYGVRPGSFSGSSQGTHRASLQEWYPAGTHEIAFDGSNLASGLYFVRMQAGDYSTVNKMILLK
jgi:subtilisin family serine protease